MSGAYALAFSTAYDPGVRVQPEPPVRYVTTNWSEGIDDHPRPRHPPYSPLWEYYRFPETQLAILLWKDGRVQVVADLEDADLADAHILGGTQWVVPEDHWQAQVMEAAGFPIVPYEGLL